MIKFIKTLFVAALGFAPALAFCQDAPKFASVIDTADRPQIFAPGIFSTPYSEWSMSFSPDGQTGYSSLGAICWTIICSKKQAGVWQKPKVASFSGRFRDTDPFITPDGKKIFFISSRPTADMPQDKPQKALHIWYADQRSNGDWGAPHHLDSIVNKPGTGNFAPSVSNKGTLFYCSRRKGLTGMQSFYNEWLGDHYGPAKQLLIKGAAEIQDPFIAPDESYMIFLNGTTIMISFKKDGQWTEAQNIGAQVNDGGGNSSPSVSPDGKWLFYSSDRVQGFFKPRDYTKPALNYDQVVQESNSPVNSNGNILMIPIHLPKS